MKGNVISDLFCFEFIKCSLVAFEFERDRKLPNFLGIYSRQLEPSK